MAGRIRSIKPELREHPALAMCSDGAFRLFIGAVTLTDDEGRCPASARYLAGAVFFGRPRAPKMVEGYLTELEAAAMITLYFASDGARYMVVRGWGERGSVTHQRIEKPQPARYPPPSPPHSGNVPGVIGERSGTDLRPRPQTTDLDSERAREGGKAEFDPLNPQHVTELAKQTCDQIAAARLEVIKALGRHDLPMQQHRAGTGSEAGWFRQLRERIKSEGAGAPIACETVVANLRRQATETRSVEWLSEKAFGDGAWIQARNGGGKRPPIASGYAPATATNFGTEMRLPAVARAERNQR